MDSVYAIEFWDSTYNEYYVSTRYIFLTYKDAQNELESAKNRDGRVIEIPIYHKGE